MKKSKLWAKFKIREELHRWWGVEGGIDEDGIKFILNIIEQIEEPEALSREWIDEHEIYIHDSNRSVIKAVPVDRLQKLLVPKQGELETKIQELIESYKQEEDAYSNPENGWISGFIEDLKNLVEKEQKYYVDLGDVAYVAKWSGDDQVDFYTDSISGSDEFELHLTEQEIKRYDERFWPFAKPVE